MNPRNKVILILSLFCIISSLLIFFVGMGCYDNNIFSSKLSAADENGDDNFITISIDEKISSKSVLDLLSFLEKQEAKHIVVDLNFENIQDQENITDIKELIKEKNNIYGFIKLKEAKGINFSKKNYSKNDKILSNLQVIKANNGFIYANYLKDLFFVNYLQIPSRNIGFIVDTKSKGKKNIDFVYKFDNRYLLSIPFMMHLKENNSLDFDNLSFKALSISFRNNVLHYDEKGRMSFSGKGIKEAKVTSLAYQEWKTHLDLRSSISGAINRLDENSSEEIKGFALYSKEEEIIDAVYSYSATNDPTKDTLLTIIKDRSKSWKAFRDSVPNIKDSTVIITVDEDRGFINNFISQKQLLKYSKNIKRLPLTLHLILLMVIFSSIILLSNIPFKKESYGYIIIGLIFVAELFLNFVFKSILKVDFYLSFYLTTTLIAVVLYLVLAKLTLFIWDKKVLEIYKGNIGKNFARKIALLWQSNKFHFSSEKKWITFISIDKMSMMPDSFDENTSDAFAIKSIDIENTIKQNYGIISSSTQKEISAYFGYPSVFKHFSILKPIKNIIKLDTGIHTAMHSSDEYFKFIPYVDIGNYTHFGNADLVLHEALKYAKEHSINVIITDVVYKELQKHITVRMLDRINIASIPNYSTRLFELILDNKKETKELIKYFHAGLKLYEETEYHKAIAYFKHCLKIVPTDVPSTKFIEKCKRLHTEKNKRRRKEDLQKMATDEANANKDKEES